MTNHSGGLVLFWAARDGTITHRMVGADGVAQPEIGTIAGTASFRSISAAAFPSSVVIAYVRRINGVDTDVVLRVAQLQRIRAVR